MSFPPPHQPYSNRMDGNPTYAMSMPAHVYPETHSPVHGKPKRTFGEKVKMALYLVAVALLVLLLLAIVFSAVMMLFDENRAFGRALRGWKVWRSGGNGNDRNAMQTNE